MTDTGLFTMTVVLSADNQTGGGYHQAFTSLRMLLTHRPPDVRILVLDARGTFGKGLKELVDKGLLAPEDIQSVPRRFPKFRDRVVVEKGFWFGFLRWLLSLRGITVGGSALARFLDLSETDLVYFVTPSLAAKDLQIKPYIWTLWDLCHLDSPEFPEVRTSGKFEARDTATALCLRKAALVVIDSDDLAVNARASYGITAEKFVRIPFAPSGSISHDSADSSLPKEIESLAGNYIFYPAQLWTHKNHRRIVEAIALLRDRNQEVHAVFVGKDHGGEGALRRAIHNLRVSDRVHLLGYVDDTVMPALYRASLGLVMASYFGPTNIPPLEAMALGVPVVASHQHREQLGDAALYFDPDNAKELAAAIETLVSQSASETLVQKGQNRLLEIADERELGYEDLSGRISNLAKRLKL